MVERPQRKTLVDVRQTVLPDLRRKTASLLPSYLIDDFLADIPGPCVQVSFKQFGRVGRVKFGPAIGLLNWPHQREALDQRLNKLPVRKSQRLDHLLPQLDVAKGADRRVQA